MSTYWIAELNDGTIINQFEGKKENTFSEVDKNMDKLKKFKVVCDKDTYEVDLSEKFIYENSHKTYIDGENPKLIYFRRNTVRLDPRTGKILDSKTNSHLGIKTDTDEKKFEIVPKIGKKTQKAYLVEKDSRKELSVASVIGEKEDGKLSMDSDV